MPRRRIVIVGRPNVGKSTLFNRLAGARKALVHDQPGVTRDALQAIVSIGDETFAELVDTGGFDPSDRSPFAEATRRIVIERLASADLLLLLVDGDEGETAGDFEVADLVRPIGKPVLVVVNKCDTRRGAESVPDFYRLGFGEPVAISAEHGRGIDELVTLVQGAVPDGGPATAPEPDAPRVAIVGRPNVGKSSLVNRLLGSERMIVSEIPGTTRDAVDSVVTVRGKSFVLVDTAGIRKKTRDALPHDLLASHLALKHLGRADVALLIIDAHQGVTSKDAAIAGAIAAANRAVVVLGNKWDLRAGETGEAEAFVQRVRAKLPMIDFAEVVLVSALSGRRTGEIWRAVERALAAGRTRVSTGELNRLLSRALAAGPSLVVGGREARLKYAAQVGIAPPTIELFVNRSGSLEPTVARYLDRKLREKVPFVGNAIVFRIAAPKPGGGRR